MTSGSSTAFGSRRVAARGRRPAGRFARPRKANVLNPWLLAIVASSLAAAACRDAHRGAHLVAAIDQLHPGSRIAVQEHVVEGARTVEVTIGRGAIPSDLARLDRDGRAVARTVSDHARLGPRDTVVVVFEAEGGPAVARETRRARLSYPVSELAAEGEVGAEVRGT